ncbi:OmpA family protein [Nesterenkonia alba]|uniref:OmpA family protein n=1 Tax=Nesterenkonia alba TaxID=515814 RepID=UPI0003B5DFF3|nr:OmpA family protein [Nesterenkonia alba]
MSTLTPDTPPSGTSFRGRCPTPTQSAEILTRARRRGHRRLVAGLGLSAALGLTACFPEGQAEFEDVDSGEDTQTTEEPDDAEEGNQTQAATEQTDQDNSPADADAGVTVEKTFVHKGVLGSGEEITMELTAGPIVAEGDLAAVPLHLEFVTGEGTVMPRDLFHGLVGITDAESAGGQVRLIDHEAMTVAELARRDGGEGQIASYCDATGDSFQCATEPGETMSWTGVFAAPEGETASVLLPHFGLVTGVPVVEGDLHDAHPTGSSENYGDMVGEAYDLVTWRQSPHYSVDVEGEETTVSLPSDVLFDVDSADLSDEADEALQAAAEEMEGTEGGQLQIIGHTDNVLDEEYNQVLSEERAEAVHARLEELTDLDAFDEVAVSGESFREPIADNTSEEGRALNRRVELHFTTVTPDEEIEVTGELPEPYGPVASADETLRLVNGGHGPNAGEELDLEVDSVQRADGLVVVGLRVTAVEDDQFLDWPLETGISTIHGGMAQLGAVDLPYLAAGDQWVEPLRYFPGDIELDEQAPEETDLHRRDYRLLTDALFAFAKTYDAGESAVAYLVYPDLGVDEVTLEAPGEDEDTSQLQRGFGVNPFRFEDVPVTDIDSNTDRAEDGDPEDDEAEDSDE